jgi:hypothetical protein
MISSHKLRYVEVKTVIFEKGFKVLQQSKLHAQIAALSAKLHAQQKTLPTPVELLKIRPFAVNLQSKN